jgi:hypothetical protein
MLQVVSHHHTHTGYGCISVLVGIWSVKWRSSCHRELHSSFYTFAFSDIDTVHVAVLQGCLGLFCGLNNWQSPFLLFATTIYPHNMVSLVKQRLSLIASLSSHVIICHIWMDCHTQCVSRADQSHLEKSSLL